MGRPAQRRNPGADGLTEDERPWALVLIKEPWLGKVEACRKAHPDWSAAKARSKVYHWLKHPDVQAYLTKAQEELRQELDIVRQQAVRQAVATRQTVLEWLTCRMLGSDPRHFLKVENGGVTIDPNRLMGLPAGVLKSVYHDRHGRLRVELHDGMPAARVLAEHYGIVGPEKGAGEDTVGRAVVQAMARELGPEKLKEIALLAISQEREIVDIH